MRHVRTPRPCVVAASISLAGHEFASRRDSAQGSSVFDPRGCEHDRTSNHRGPGLARLVATRLSDTPSDGPRLHHVARPRVPPTRPGGGRHDF